MNRKLWLDKRGVPVITTTRNGENNAVRWGWTPATARPLPDKEEVIDLLKREFWPFLAHDPVDPARFWGNSADAVLTLLKGTES